MDRISSVRRWVIAAALAGALAPLQGVLAAQIASTTAGAIIGQVKDSAGGSMSGVKVTAKSPAAMGSPATTTDQNGVYRIPALSPGDYSLTFEQTGFGTETIENIRVDIGFTATVNAELKPGAVTQNIIVTSKAPVIDVDSNTVSTTIESSDLARLPGSRDFWGIVGLTPAVSLSRMDVGGSNALTQQPYTAYGLSSGGGVNRGEVEGVMVNEGSGGGGSDFYYLDFSAMQEVSVNAVANTAMMPNPGVLTQFIAKTGGNRYHGDVYYDYESDSLEATNIDHGQIATGLAGSSVLGVTQLNRLSKFSDFAADTGGYIIKDKLWWFGAYRYTVTDQRYPTLLDDVQHTWAPVYTGKITYNLTDKHRLTGFYQHENKTQPDYLGAILISGGRQSPAEMTKDAVWHSTFPLFVWKAEYDWIVSPSLLFEVRTGQYHSNWQRTGKSSLPRVEDIGNDFVSGGVYATNNLRSRPQVNGDLTYTKSGWLGTHNFKFGGEYMRDTLVEPFGPFPNSCNCVSVLNNGKPLDVYLYLSNVSKNGDSTTAFYVNDTWNVSKRLTINAGVRFDRNNLFLPGQVGPSGQQFTAVSSVIAWNNWGPRVGLTYDLTGDGRTVVKASFGQFFLYPGSDGAVSFNPNPPGWYNEYAWTDANSNGVWDPGEQGKLIAASGGAAATVVDPRTKNTYTLQGTMYVERQISSGFALRTGFVWNGRRDVRGSVNINRPLAAYSVPATVTDPGPYNNSPGQTFTAWNLAPAYLNLPVVNTTVNLPENSNYYTWEITATRRLVSKWSLLGTFAKTWAVETPLGTGSSFTPNALINTDGGLNHYYNWQGKLTSTIQLPWRIEMTPILRVQSGVPFGRTFVSSLNYGSATILAVPYGTLRTANIPLFDLRIEKSFIFHDRYRATGFFDAYNIFNNNAEQAVTTSSGSAFLRPSAITPPRIARLGIKFQF